MGGVRKFYQFQSRLMQNGFSELFDVSVSSSHPPSPLLLALTIIIATRPSFKSFIFGYLSI
jgi:hypothetical protein